MPLAANIFVGRTRECDLFHRMVQDPRRRRWVLNIYGEGGIGKTRLIAQLYNLCAEIGLADRRTGIVDFYDLDNRRKVGLIKSISDSLGFDLPSISAYNQASEAETASELLRAEEAVVREFRDKLSELYQDGHPIVFFFDTFDGNIQQADIGRWFVTECLPLIHNACPSIVVVGGRRAIDAPDELNMQIAYAPLGKLTQEETAAFFGEAGLSDLDSEDVAALWEKARKGRPILVAILADWLTVGRVHPDEILSIPDARFESGLLEFILGPAMVNDAERRLVLLMAHLHHRFDEEVFRAVHSPEDGKLFNPNPVFRDLSRFSFIKYRRQVPSCLLHDEMRDLIVQYVFPDFDTHGDTRSRWSIDVSARYYSPKIAVATDRMTVQTLQAEQLYHECYAYVNNGEFNAEILRVKPDLSLPMGSTPLTLLWYRLDESWRPRNLDQMELLLQILERVSWVLKLREMEKVEEQERFQFLSWIKDVGIGWLRVSQSRFAEAEEILRDVLSDEKLPDRLRATALAALGESAYQQRMDDEAVKYLKQAMIIFERLEALDSDLPLIIATEKGIPAERHRILNTFGIIHRRHGELDKALEMYEKAFRLAEKVGDVEWAAAAQNNIGNVYRYQGRYGKARTYCRRAMERRRELGYELDIGLSHNTLGLVYRDLGEYSDAREHTEEALRIFRKYNPEHQVRALINLGYIEYLTGNSDEAMHWYEKAKRLCDKHNLRFHMPRLLSKLGLLYQQRGELDQAEDAFRKGHDIAVKYKDALFEVVNLEYLARLKYLRGDKEEARRLAKEILKRKGVYQFRISFGEAELLLGHVAWDEGSKNEAYQHYAEAYAHFAKHNEAYMVKRLKVLEDQLLKMSDEDRKACTSQLRRYWEREKLDEQYEALIDTCEIWGS